jgi:hypothetical protein
MAGNAVDTVKEKVNSFTNDAEEAAPVAPAEDANRVEEDAD